MGRNYSKGKFIKRSPLVGLFEVLNYGEKSYQGRENDFSTDTGKGGSSYLIKSIFAFIKNMPLKSIREKNSSRRI